MSDYVPFENYLLGPFGNTVQRHCFEVEIVDDKDIEDYEEFTVGIRQHHNSGLYYPQVIEPDMATIRILDNDCKCETSSYYLIISSQGIAYI